MYIEAVPLSCALFLHHKYSLQWMKAVLDYYNAKPCPMPGTHTLKFIDHILPKGLVGLS